MNLRGVVRGNVLWLGMVSLFTDMSSEMIYPLLPIFLMQTLGAGPAFLGLIEGVAETTASMLKLASGWFSDRIGRRKPLVLAGYGLAGAVRPMIALATTPWHVLAVRFTDRVGKGIRTAPRDALLADSVPAAQHGAAFGFHRGADHAGAVLGPLLASIILFAAPGNYRLVFVLAAVPAVISLLILWLKVREQRGTSVAAPGIVRFQGFRDVPGSLRLFLFIVVVFALGNATDAFLLLRAQQLGVPLALIPALWAALHVSKMIWSVPGGMLADRFGPRRSIIAGWLLYALLYAAFAGATDAWHVWVLFLLYGLFFGLTEAPEKALVASLALPDRRGTAFGAYHFALGTAALPASVIFGVLWQSYGAPVALLTGSGFALLATVLLLFIKLDIR